MELILIDKTRVYLSGASMGGYTCWSVAMMRPEWFAAIIPICGGGMNWNASRLRNVPIWAFHGALDTVVSVEESKNMVDSVNKIGGNAKLTVYDNISLYINAFRVSQIAKSHNSWGRTFSDDNLYEWLTEQTI